MTILDVPETSDKFNAINFIIKIGLAAIYPDGKFYPEKTITIAEACTLICRFLEYDSKLIDSLAYPFGYMDRCKELDLIDNSFLASEPMKLSDMYNLFYKCTNHKPMLDIPELKIQSQGNIATRNDIAKLIYDTCKKTGQKFNNLVAENNKNKNWKESLNLIDKFLSKYAICKQFFNSEIIFIYNFLNKIYSNRFYKYYLKNIANIEIYYNYMLQILDCKKKHFSQKKNNEIIYHYTNISALEKMTQPNSKFHLSNVAYLNDPMEGRLFINLTKQLIKKKDFPKWNFLNNKPDELSVSNSFVASFIRQDKEKLPMWVQYGDNAKGCMIGIESSSISAPLYEIIYDIKKANNYINSIKDILLFYKKEDGNIDMNNDVVFSYAAESLTQISYLYKDTYYEHEREVRILLFADLNTVKEEQIIRDGEYFPRLFVELNNMPKFDSITLGPKSKDIEKIAVSLSRRGYQNVEKSKIHFK